MKKFLTLLFITFMISISIVGCGDKQEPSTNNAQINYTEQTFTCIDKLVNRDFSSFYSYFDETMKKQVTESDIHKIWDELIAAYGTFDYYQTDITIEAKEGYQIVDIPCYFQDGSVTIRLTFNQHGQICGFFITNSTTASNSLQLPQDSEVTFGSEEYPIAGSLTLPEGDGPFPAVILVHGSGPSDRNEQIGPNLPFMDLASQLSQQGIAVLRYDKRTYLYATEMAAMDHITVQDETIDDVVAAFEFLKTRNTIQEDQIYIVGHSLGGYLIPRIAQQTPDAAGYIMMAAPARPMEDLMLEQTKYILSLEKELDDPSKEALLKQTSDMVNRIKNLTPDSKDTPDQLGNVPVSYWLDLQHYDPVTEAQQIKKPLLFLQGARDYQVSLTDFDLWKKALEDHPSADATFYLYDNLNHLFMTGTGKSTPAEYQQKGTLETKVGDTIADFVFNNE